MRKTDIGVAIARRPVAGLALALFLFASRAPGQTPWASDCPAVANSKVGSVTWTPALCQEFNGPLGPPSTTAWSFDLGSSGWGNNEVETYCGPPGYPKNPSPCPASFSTKTANSYLDGSGHLVIQVIERAGSWYSARLKTEGIQNFQFGRIEASLKIPDTTTPGLWPAFWWLGSNIAAGAAWPLCGEADIMENWSPAVFNGPGPTHNQSSIHTKLTGGNGIHGAYSFPSGQQADAGFYAYGVIWSANMLQFYVNSTTKPPSSLSPFFIVTTSDLPAGDTWPFNVSAFLIMNVAVGGTLGGSTAGTPSPDMMMIDYVRQYMPSAMPAPVLGQPPGITVTAGATAHNTSRFTPSLAAGTGYVYFSCDTTAPKASCSIQTDDPLNHFVVNSGASPPESVTVAVTTTSKEVALPRYLSPKMGSAFWLSTMFVLVLLTLLVRLKRRRVGRSLRLSMVLGSLVLAATLIIGCGAVSGGAGDTGTTPGSYTVTVYAFTESNLSNGAKSNADARANISLKVN